MLYLVFGLTCLTDLAVGPVLLSAWLVRLSALEIRLSAWPVANLPDWSRCLPKALAFVCLTGWVDCLTGMDVRPIGLAVCLACQAVCLTFLVVCCTCMAGSRFGSLSA
jgi:hypothetical protein